MTKLHLNLKIGSIKSIVFKTGLQILVVKEKIGEAVENISKQTKL